MRRYFDFNLTGKKLLPFWLLFMFFVVAPYFVALVSLRKNQPGGATAFLTLAFIALLMVIAFIIGYYIIKLSIVHFAYNGKGIEFDGYFGKFMDVFILGFFLTIITIGIYGPWFIRDLHRFFINNSSYNAQPFNFKGKGNTLFVIILLSVIVPSIIIGITLGVLIVKGPGQKSSSAPLIHVFIF